MAPGRPPGPVHTPRSGVPEKIGHSVRPGICPHETGRPQRKPRKAADRRRNAL